MSVKRRRGIGMRKWLVAALKDYAKRENIASHTMVANKILRGKLPPIRSYEKYKEGDQAKQGVSMPEELWLAIKAYSKQRGKDESDTQIACKIIVGKIPPIPDYCIEKGKALARKREAARSPNEEPERPKKKAKKKVEKKTKKKKATKKVETKTAAFSKEAIKKAEKDIAQRDKDGAAEFPGATGLPPGMSSKEFLDKVKEESQEQEALESRAEKKVGEDGRTLSKGEPFEERPAHKNREIDPDADHFGGVFKM